MTDEEQREIYRLKMVELRDQAHGYKKLIQEIDAKNDEEYRNSIINKCFRLKNNGDYVRVESFRGSDMRPYGTVLYVIEEDGQKYGGINCNTIIWSDDLKEANPISRQEFNTLLADVKNMFKIY